VKARLAGRGSTLSARSIALTKNVWAPLPSGELGVWVAPGPKQDANPAPSNRHSNLEPGSSEVKPKVGVASLVVPDGPEVIVVSGGSVSGGGGWPPLPTTVSCGSEYVVSSSAILATAAALRAAPAIRE
jgi:hypothetical protein